MIAVKDITFSYSSDFKIEDLSFVIPKGAFCAVLGPNGSGKSTLFKLLSKQLKHEKGSIVIDQIPLPLLTPELLSKKVAIVPQQLHSPFHFTVFDMVMMGRNPYQSRWDFGSKADEALVIEALKQTNMLHLKDRCTNHLSGGEMQRALIARAIAQQTPIILLDEPLSNLDVVHKYEIMDILTQLNQKQNRTIVMILHDFSFAKQYTAQTLLMKEGSLVAFDTTDNIFKNHELLLDTFHLNPSFVLDDFGNVRKMKTSE